MYSGDKGENCTLHDETWFAVLERKRKKEVKVKNFGKVALSGSSSSSVCTLPLHVSVVSLLLLSAQLFLQRRICIAL